MFRLMCYIYVHPFMWMYNFSSLILENNIPNVLSINIYILMIVQNVMFLNKPHIYQAAANPREKF